MVGSESMDICESKVRRVPSWYSGKRRQLTVHIAEAREAHAMDGMEVVHGAITSSRRAHVVNTVSCVFMRASRWKNKYIGRSVPAGPDLKELRDVFSTGSRHKTHFRSLLLT